MKAKSKVGRKNTGKPAKADSTSVRKMAAGKTTVLSKTTKAKVEQSKPDKPKPAKSSSKSSKSRGSVKPVAAMKGQGRPSKDDMPKSIKSPSAAPTPRPFKSEASPQPNRVVEATKISLPSFLDYQEQRARIARRAYELFEERCPPDGDVQDWVRAEREIMQES